MERYLETDNSTLCRNDGDYVDGIGISNSVAKYSYLVGWSKM